MERNISMINFKTQEDINNIKTAIGIGLLALDKIQVYIKPGVTTLYLNTIIEKMITMAGGQPSFKGFENFPFATCMSVNKNIIHGLPNDTQIKKGDIITIDVGVEYNGRYSDQARTYIIGQPKSEQIMTLVYATREALDKAIHVAIPGNTTKDISCAIEATAQKYGLGILKNYSGHGVGLAVHEDPQIFNQVLNHPKVKYVPLQKGMVIAIEPMFVIGQGNSTKAKDGWTIKADGIGAHFEKTVIIE